MSLLSRGNSVCVLGSLLEVKSVFEQVFLILHLILVTVHFVSFVSKRGKNLFQDDICPFTSLFQPRSISTPLRSPCVEWGRIRSE